MSEHKNSSPKKRGPNPIGDAAMTSTERARRRRELLRAGGGKGFLVELSGDHLKYVDGFARLLGVSTASALHQVIDPMLDRFVGVIRRSERLRDNGATDEECQQFVVTHLFPALPPIHKKACVDE
jgi:hypothetical protein